MGSPEIIWLDIQPSLYGFNCRLVRLLTASRRVKRWSFQHDPDEACTIDTIHNLLRESIVSSKQRPHVVAHGISGTIACLFAQQYPELLSSLTLLSVDTNNANHWTSHYHVMRGQLPCSRDKILTNLASKLFDVEDQRIIATLAKLMAKCLDCDFVISSLFSNSLSGHLQAPKVPTLIINGDYDFVVDKAAKTRWNSKLKLGDHYESVDAGRHFFHFHKPALTAEKINAFLDMIPTSSFPDVAPTNSLTAR